MGSKEKKTGTGDLVEIYDKSSNDRVTTKERTMPWFCQKCKVLIENNEKGFLSEGSLLCDKCYRTLQDANNPVPEKDPVPEPTIQQEGDTVENKVIQPSSSRGNGFGFLLFCWILMALHGLILHSVFTGGNTEMLNIFDEFIHQPSGQTIAIMLGGFLGSNVLLLLAFFIGWFVWGYYKNPFGGTTMIISACILVGQLILGAILAGTVEQHTRYSQFSPNIQNNSIVPSRDSYSNSNSSSQNSSALRKSSADWERVAKALEGLEKSKKLPGFGDTNQIKYVSSKDGFSISFPSAPQINEVDSTIGNTTVKVRNYQAVSKDNKVFFNVFVNIFEKKMLKQEVQEAFLNNFLNGRLLPTKNAKVIENRPEVYQEFPGTYFKYTTEQDGLQFVHEGIAFIFDGDSFSLTCVYPTTSASLFSEFKKSFELIPLESTLSDQYWMDATNNIKIRQPRDMSVRSSKSSNNVVVTFVNPSGHSISIFDISEQYDSIMSEIDTAYPGTTMDPDGFYTINTKDLRGRDIVLLWSFVHYANKTYMVQGSSDKPTYFRYVKIFKESMKTLTFEN